MAVQGILCRGLAGGCGLSAAGGGLGGGAGGFCVLIISMLTGWRPPGAIFFLLRRRKNMGRKTPRRAGGPRPTDPPPWVGVGGRGGLVRATRQICECIRALYPVSRPLAAALLLTHCGCDLMAFFGAGNRCVLIFSMQAGWRPPGAIFFLLRRRKNMERKTPRRAGWSPPYGPTPLGGCRGCGWVGTGYQTNLRVHPCPDSR